MYGYETNSSISNVTNSLRIGNVSSPTAPLSLSWNYNHHLFHGQNTANDAVISLDSGTGKCSAILFDSVYAGVDSANVFHIKQQSVARPVFLDSRNMLFIGNVFRQENANGWVEIGALNASFSHITASQATVFFYQPVSTDTFTCRNWINITNSYGSTSLYPALTAYSVFDTTSACGFSFHAGNKDKRWSCYIWKR